EFHNKQLYEKVFGDSEKRQRFLKWRIQYLEKGIRERLDFTPGGISSMVQVTDLKNSPRLGKHRQVTKQAVTLLQDNYPEFIAKKRTKSKFRANAENGYTVIVQKTRKLVADDEPVIRSSFKISEPGKVVLDIENLTSKKKKKLLYRYKVKRST
ncbi:hypothetical protein GW17_00013238, partial [Ensete ventricosum]